MDSTYKVKLDTFEGPLDLLLHLVNQLEIDIYDIPVAEITYQYMQFIQAMQRIELNVASEYLVMAATLLEIKSAMLLPKQEVTMEDEYEEDPREELINRLIEYRKYKEVAALLKEKELAENEIYTRAPQQFEDLLQHAPPQVKGDVSVYDMLHAVDKMLQRKAWQAPLETTVNHVEVSVEQRMDEILHLVKQTDEKVLFDELFPYPTRSHIVTTLLAILQLLKINEINCSQEHHFQPIYVYRMEE